MNRKGKKGKNQLFHTKATNTNFVCGNTKYQPRKGTKTCGHTGIHWDTRRKNTLGKTTKANSRDNMHISIVYTLSDVSNVESLRDLHHRAYNRNNPCNKFMPPMLTHQINVVTFRRFGWDATVPTWQAQRRPGEPENQRRSSRHSEVPAKLNENC